MHRKNVLVATRQLELAHRLKAVFSTMDVEARFANASVMPALTQCRGLELDLIVADDDQENLSNLAKIEDMLFQMLLMCWWHVLSIRATSPK